MNSTKDLLNSKNIFFKKNSKKIDYAILSAIPDELIFVQKVFKSFPYEKITILNFDLKIYEYNDSRILVASTGLGITFAASIVTLIHYKFSPEYILFIGTAGAMQSNLEIADVVIIENAFEAEIQNIFNSLKDTPFEIYLTHPLINKRFPSTYPADNELFNIVKNINFINNKVHIGTGVSSSTFPAPSELFEKIKIKAPLAIDMETSAFYQVGWLLQAKVLAIRGISNIINNNGKDEYIHDADIIGSVKAATNVLFKIIDTLILKNKKTKAIQQKNFLEHEAEMFINLLNLQPHPEGGYYTPTFQSTDTVTSIEDKYNNEPRKAGSAIFYLLKENDFSAWHCLKSDEIWHYYKGSIIKIYVIDNDGSLSTFLLGNPIENPRASFQVFIKAGHYFAAEILDKNSYALVGCTVSPAFDFKDFKLGGRSELLKIYPQHSTIIEQFTRVSDIKIQPGKL